MRVFWRVLHALLHGTTSTLRTNPVSLKGSKWGWVASQRVGFPVEWACSKLSYLMCCPPNEQPTMVEVCCLID